MTPRIIRPRRAVSILAFAMSLLYVSPVSAQEPSENVTVRTMVVEWVAMGVELLAVVVVVIGISCGTVLFAFRVLRRSSQGLAAYEIYKRHIGRTLLLALELLVASDILITVIFKPSLEHVAILGGLVLIRTFLSWSLGVEIEGRWPWQPRRSIEPMDDKAEEPCKMS